MANNGGPLFRRITKGNKAECVQAVGSRKNVGVSLPRIVQKKGQSVAQKINTFSG